MTADSRKIAPHDVGNYPERRSKYFLTTSQKVVQSFLKVRRRLRELTADLKHIFLIALLNLVLEELLQCSVSQPILPLLWKIRHEI